MQISEIKDAIELCDILDVYLTSKMTMAQADKDGERFNESRDTRKEILDKKEMLLNKAIAEITKLK